MHKSIRFRLTAWYAVILTASLALFGGLLWLALRHSLLGDVDRELDASATRFARYFQSESADATSRSQLRDELDEFCQALPSGNFIHLHGANGFDFRYPAGAPPSADFRALHRDFEQAGERFTLDVRAPIGDVLHTLDLVRWLLLSLLPVTIVVACAGGAWLSRRALRPVQDVTAAALNISIGNLSKRLPVPETGDELAQLAEVLNTMLTRLEAAVNTLSQFVANASHELRTPLAVIRTNAELALRRSRTADSYRDSLEEIAADAERMTKLVEDLLTLARSDTGTEQMPLEPLDAREVLEDVINAMRPLCDVRGVRIAAGLGDERAMIPANRAGLRRLFLALLDNALKYSPAGGAIEVSVSHAQERIAVAVKDSGAGIRAEDLPHIFERFYRADPARSGGGHGLGLSLAQNIAKAHGAEISVESQEGAGSRFTIAFPAARGISANLQIARVV